MGSLYRSEPMSRCQLFLHSDTVFDVVAKLGELGLVQFIDLNPERSAFQRRFMNELKRCDQMAGKLKCIERQILMDGIVIPEVNEFVPAPFPSEMNTLEESSSSSKKVSASVSNGLDLQSQVRMPKCFEASAEVDTMPYALDCLTI
ncbi:unnamed protein product [Gongylonema pulchrum]|uniref:V-type proton ATPase subunit a n=1 Tax=Gongylonema pulchrum TaxID=637853 RepID=A0A183D1S9_9BILA|nr:unnamed protein product [Gongylonema pulchrum]